MSSITENCHVQKPPPAGLWLQCQIKALMSRGGSIREIARCQGQSPEQTEGRLKLLGEETAGPGGPQGGRR